MDPPSPGATRELGVQHSVVTVRYTPRTGGRQGTASRSFRLFTGLPRALLPGSSANKEGHDNPTRTLATSETPASRRESVATAGSARRQRLRPRAEGIPRRAQGGRCPPEVSGIHVGRTNSTTARTIAAKRRARLRMSTAFSPIVHGGERRWRTDTSLWLRSTRCLVSRRSRSLGPTVSPSACGPIIISTPC
jgi:hypothetical protein